MHDSQSAIHFMLLFFLLTSMKKDGWQKVREITKIKSQWRTTLWYLVLGEQLSDGSQGIIPLFLLNPLVLIYGVVAVTGGISMESSGGGGCCHCGSGPANRSVWSSGPASITACKNLPLLGNGLFIGNSVASCGGGGGGSGSRRIGSLPGEEMMLSSQSEEDKLVAVLDSWSSCCCCCCCCCCWRVVNFCKSSFWYWACASSLSLMVLVRRSVSWLSSSSFLAISSWADRIVDCSSRVVYIRQCLSSSVPSSWW